MLIDIFISYYHLFQAMITMVLFIKCTILTLTLPVDGMENCHTPYVTEVGDMLSGAFKHKTGGIRFAVQVLKCLKYFCK